MITLQGTEKIRIKTMNDLRFAKKICRYEAAIHDQALVTSINHFKTNIGVAIKNTSKEIAQKLLIVAINKLIKPKK